MQFKTLTALFVILFTTSLFAQDVKQEIASEFTSYQNAISQGHFKEAMEYITPEFFAIYPKEEVVDLMEKTFNNPSITFEIKDMKIENIAEPEAIEGKHYALLTYSNAMIMKFNENEDENEEQKGSRLAMTRIALEQSFGSNNVGYDPATDAFIVKAEKSVYAISADGRSDWKFLAVEKGQEEVLERILPRELMNRM